MAKTAKVDSREVGLVADLNPFNFFLGSKDLHYGLWDDDLPITGSTSSILLQKQG